MSVSGKSSISACQSRYCCSLPTGSDCQKFPPRCRHAHSFRTFLGIFLLDTHFSSVTVILLHRDLFVRAFDTLEILVHGSRVWSLTWIRTYWIYILNDHQLTVSRFVLAVASMGRDWQIQKWTWFFRQKLFCPVPSKADFNCQLFFKASTSIFCVQNSAMPIAQYLSFP